MSEISEESATFTQFEVSGSFAGSHIEDVTVIRRCKRVNSRCESRPASKRTQFTRESRRFQKAPKSRKESRVNLV